MTDAKLCPKCGAPRTNVNSQFCGQCGAEYEKTIHPQPVQDAVKPDILSIPSTSCPKCDAPRINVNDQFCGQCGAEYEKTAHPQPVQDAVKPDILLIPSSSCPKCGTPRTDINAQFCGQCGAEYEKTAHPQPVQDEVKPDILSKIPSGKKGLIIIAGIVIVVLIGGILLYSASSQPENAVIQYLQHINNGEYSQAADLIVDSTTLQPLSDAQKAYLRTTMEATLGPTGENIRINNITILSKQKINDNQYLITVSLGMKSSNSNGFQTSSGTLRVVKVNGQWNVAESITGLQVASPSGSTTNPQVNPNSMVTAIPAPSTLPNENTPYRQVDNTPIQTPIITQIPGPTGTFLPEGQLVSDSVGGGQSKIYYFEVDNSENNIQHIDITESGPGYNYYFLIGYGYIPTSNPSHSDGGSNKGDFTEKWVSYNLPSGRFYVYVVVKNYGPSGGCTILKDTFFK